MAKQRAKSLRFNDEEEAEIRSYVELTGEPEALVLERVALRGLRQERLERGLLSYLETRDSIHAASVGGITRHALLREAAERGMVVGDTSADDLFRDLAQVADLLGQERLAEAVRAAADAHHAP